MSGTITTPPSAPFSQNPLSDQEKADCRRFAGYPPFGGLNAVGFETWRFFQTYGLLEFRMNNLNQFELQNVRYYLSQLYPLETAVFASSTNLDTDQASVWKHNKQEVADRERLFTLIRKRFCTLLGIPPGPDLADADSARVVI